MANKKGGCLTIVAAIIVLIGWGIQQLDVLTTNDGTVDPDPTVDRSTPGTSAGGTHIYGGKPRPNGYPNVLKTLQREGFVVGYDESRGVPAWVSYRLGPAKFDNGERPRNFTVDQQTVARISHDDYTRSGYDRGHMAPNYAIATRYGREAQLQTFKMTNIIPQSPLLNRGLWRSLEERISGGGGLAQKLGEVWVITGPLFSRSPRTLPNTAIAIPEACYKIVVDEVNGKPRAMAFRFPQDLPEDSELSRFLTSVDAIEAAAGLDFLASLPDDLESAVESEKLRTPW